MAVRFPPLFKCFRNISGFFYEGKFCCLPSSVRAGERCQGEKMMQPCRNNIFQAGRIGLRFSCSQKTNVIKISLASI